MALAHSGPEGVRAALTSAPEVIVCDIGLPGMSGHAVCEELRKHAHLQRTLFVAQTGHAADAGGEPGAGAFDLYLLKPVDPVELARVIAAGHLAPAES